MPPPEGGGLDPGLMLPGPGPCTAAGGGPSAGRPVAGGCSAPGPGTHATGVVPAAAAREPDAGRRAPSGIRDAKSRSCAATSRGARGQRSFKDQAPWAVRSSGANASRGLSGDDAQVVHVGAAGAGGGGADPVVPGHRVAVTRTVLHSLHEPVAGNGTRRRRSRSRAGPAAAGWCCRWRGAAPDRSRRRRGRSPSIR